ncbi:complex I NDUFA9 subunit family protein [Mesorhizobium sp. M1C.F.Ca.ET.193.01.1.1]|uniref:complex I NDUFA9 subunit family protein n=1 Tax=unclassified Mesorhizobium TaxID=325217 RepID=UPI000FD4435F|nr:MULTISPECIES: complex I NDUFA9 subunit family protein [unclassified Mesorhizobium]TGT00028.1 complex I NDUFA9 subunit family protein [bacterium M00.F.Ca.ET.177.01.1.1]TGQ53423.1 complex I NDUFA9 subunit family protein [Mesorhizobium sp. M1C.F.Ca.ET.210.01.1.1]TGQ70690.1 complex I NDUFA9 subunit family protein [Mesorhizobium sp. M1C.F.Ca.ET.212.01.1.1]TGR07263.1 complex I NDUFA9 subunit family protein [Mesorhizobium sp. M1C.F.Ca.ET.204.01.1.1]TGR28137.1 complex I NDUFA9 subunit family protei
MAAMNHRVVTVFGGTGFLGRRVVPHLRDGGLFVRIASRHPERAKRLFGSDDPQLQPVEADIHDERAIAHALAGAYGVVNAVSLYVEQGRETFHSVHVESARRVAAEAHRAGVERFAHVSGIGSDVASPSLYIRKRGEGEQAVRAAFADAIIIRPAVMFGPDDAFLTTILKLLRRLPIYPMFGRGLTRLQPAYVGDVAQATARVLQGTQTHAITYECGGPRVYSYEEFLRAVAHQAGLRPILVPVPFVAWHALAWAAEMLASPPVTRNQVELMQVDNVSSPQMPGFEELGISPHPVEEILQEMLRDH